MTKNSPLKYVTNKSTSSVAAIGSGIANASNRFTPISVNGCEEMLHVDRPVFVLEKHMAVIRKGPTAAPQLEMFPYQEGRDVINTVSATNEAIIKSTFRGFYMHSSYNWSGGPASGFPKGTAFDGSNITMFYAPNKEPIKAGEEIRLPIDVTDTGEDWEVNDQVLVEFEYNDSFDLPRKATARLQIEELVVDPTTETTTLTHPTTGATEVGYWGKTNNADRNWIRTRLVSSTGDFPMTHQDLNALGTKDIYTVSLVQKPAIFELKFPKFGYRYKYADGEYSVFGPWSEIAFIPGDFDYLPKKGYNLGMQNKLRSLNIKNWVPKNIPEDVVQVDILYKESNSPSIYTVSSHKKDDPAEESGKPNFWNQIGTGGNSGNYTIKSELIHKVVAGNQLLRPWDNVPRKALAQEITANRLIFANYVQNFDMKDMNGDEVRASFAPLVESSDFSTDGSSPAPNKAAKSLKSMRTYQLGVVYRDRYGRETPVMTSKSGSVKLEKEKAKLANRLSVKLNNNPPYWAESYTFYIKETSNEYYNLAMDRWYDAEDGGVWLSFPSSERNKIQDTTNLILKKQHDRDVFTDFDVKYKVLSIKGNAPTFIKTEMKYWGNLPMMLPPPGWGGGQRNGGNGGWDSGMFYNTGLPLPNRMYLDIYADYWNQSSLASLSSKSGAQIRMVQSSGGNNAYDPNRGDSTNKTNWYDISTITKIGSPPQTEQREVTDPVTGITTITEVEQPGQVEQLVRISLEKAMGNDAAFCAPDDRLSLARRLTLEARTKIVRDKSEFEGRFFVKVLRDANVELNIVQPQQESDDQYQVLFTKDLAYLNFAQPGQQDWNFTKYIPPAIAPGGSSNLLDTNSALILSDWQEGTITNPSTGINDDAPYNIPTGVAHARLVSSLPSNHADNYCSYTNSQGTVLLHPTTNDKALWPFGPGDVTLGSGGGDSTANWNSTTIKFYSPFGVYNPGTPSPDNYTLTHLTLAGTAAINKRDNDWPSYSPGQWYPYIDHGGNTPANVNGGTAYDNRDSNLPFTTIGSNIHGDYVVRNGEEETTGEGYKKNNYTYGTNPYNVPAIFGDQTDLLLSSPIFDEGTIIKLREDWYYLFYGRDKVSESWPHSSFTPDRWFIDKAGAASGHCGNGIWDNGTSGFMDVSFWGIGNFSYDDKESRTSDWETLIRSHQENEYGFAVALATPGTQFRFKYDPDQIVYTITNANREQVYNFEAPQGRWATKSMTTETKTITTTEVDPAGGPDIEVSEEVTEEVPKFSGGAGIGKGTDPMNPSWSGGDAYLSDLFEVGLGSYKHLKNGGNPMNKRIRFKLSLDKIIGQQGVHKFHPLRNHVDADGKANVNKGKQRYDVGLRSGHVNTHKGGTPTDTRHYNLNSYWNAGEPAYDQPDDSNSAFYDDGIAYIGLHERGLNNTEIQIITPYRGTDRDIPMSSKPAIWETEPTEDVGLDIYYAASSSYPISLDRYRADDMMSGPDETDPDGANWYDYSFRGEEVIKVGSVVQTALDPVTPTVCHIQGDTIWLNDKFDTNLHNGDSIKFVHQGEGSFYGVGRDDEYIEFKIETMLTPTCYRLQTNTHGYRRGLSYFNCWSYGTGVEANRMRDDYNAVTIDKGVKASMPLATPYEEERRSSGLIFSGIYNSTSGINETNQFIQAEPITKDLNPISGSIQKLYARDTDLVTFTENKVFKILANKDALFNANGNSQLTGNANVLGQTIPFSGEYGISKNPESFAAESYRMYFTDKSRGAVLRLSKDGLTPISDQGMKDWFKDNLRFATSLIGSHDDRDNQYNLTVETADQDGNEKAYTLSYTEARRGWLSFKSFVHQGGISHKNIYYTSPSNKYGRQPTEDPWGVPYSAPSTGLGEMWRHSLDLTINRLVKTAVSNSLSVTVNDSTVGVIIAGMVVEGNGIPIDTFVNDVYCNGTDCQLNLSSLCFLSKDTQLTFTTARNSFYDIQDHYSMVKVLFSDTAGDVKRFKTLSYEGTQAKTLVELQNNYQLEGVSVGQIYYDNYPKKGWYVETIDTDMQEGQISEFINKENKWFNYLRGFEDAGEHDALDTGEFSLQGLGFTETQRYVETYNCTNGSCYDPGDGSGDYRGTTALLDCTTDCAPIGVSYDCLSNGGCVDPLTGQGLYTDLISCQNACASTVLATYDCGIYGCYDPGDGSGYFSDFSSCDAACNQIGGCTEVLACNYDPNATNDDGSCLGWNYTDSVVGFTGCTDPTACNYDSLANCDDGSCEFTSCLTGCMDPLAFNYDPNAETDNGTCVDCINGCTDPLACNYDPLATCDNGDCLTIYGCTDVDDPNYDPNAQCHRDNDCANCEAPDPPRATSWDCVGGTCTEIIGTSGYADENSCIAGTQDCFDPEPPAPDTSYDCIDGECGEIMGLDGTYSTLSGCRAGMGSPCSSTNQQETSWDCVNGECAEIVGTAGTYIDEPSCKAAEECGGTEPHNHDHVWQCIYGGCYEVVDNGQSNTFANYKACISGCQEVRDDGEPRGPSGPGTTDVYGCTDLLDVNYNPLATIDDGSCCALDTLNMVSGNDGINSPNGGNKISRFGSMSSDQTTFGIAPVYGLYVANSTSQTWPSGITSLVSGGHTTRGLTYNAGSNFHNSQIGGNVFIESYVFEPTNLVSGQQYTLRWHEIVLALHNYGTCSDCLQGGWEIRHDDGSATMSGASHIPAAVISAATVLYDPVALNDLTEAAATYRTNNNNNNAGSPAPGTSDFNASINALGNPGNLNTAGAPVYVGDVQTGQQSDSEWNQKCVSFTAGATNRLHIFTTTDWTKCTDSYKSSCANGVHGVYMGITRVHLEDSCGGGCNATTGGPLTQAAITVAPARVGSTVLKSPITNPRTY